MPKFVTIQNLEQYNSKINPRIQDLEQVSDLGYLVNYIKQTQQITYTVELDGKTYTCKANVDQSESLPKLSDIEDYYGFSQIKEYVETLKNTDYLTLSGGNLTGSLTINNQKVATEDFVTESINNLNSTYLGISAKAESAKSADSVAWDNVSDKPSTFTPSSHTHDDRYYTESEIDTKLSSKSDTTHNHDSVYLGIDDNASTSSKLQNARVLTIADGLGNSGAGVSFDGSKNVTISLPPYIATQLLKDRTKNDGNDYYDDSDITSLIYAGNGAGTLRNEIANGNFSRVHPGQTIVGRVTGTTYVVVGCNIYKYRGNTELTNHIGLMPIQLIGNAGNLLWSGRTYAGSGVNNTNQGYAPWASDNDTEGKNQTSCYKDSYIANTVLPKVDNLWLKPDFENQGISILTFRNLEATSFDTNATCMSNPNWRGCATIWEWNSRRLVLPSEPEIYGHYHWAGSPWESGSQHTQLPLYRHKEIHKVYPRVDIWLKDSASASDACDVNNGGVAHNNGASGVFRVCPVFLIA